MIIEFRKLTLHIILFFFYFCIVFLLNTTLTEIIIKVFVDKNEFYTAPVECFFFGFRFPWFPLWVLINFQIPTKCTFCTFNSYTSTLCMIKIYFMYTCVKFNYNYNYIKASKLLFLYV